MAYNRIFYLSKIYKNKIVCPLPISQLSSVRFCRCVLGGDRRGFPVSLRSTRGRESDELKVFALVCVWEGGRARVQPLDEMDLPLVLPRPGRFDGPPFPGKSHVPAVILGILERRVVVLQHDLGEDAVPAPAAGLRENTEKVLVLKPDGQAARHADSSTHPHPLT